MNTILRFWRDVEIFNIPDAPSAIKPGRPGNAPLPDVGDAEDDEADGDAGLAIPADASQADQRPRVSVVQTFSTDGVNAAGTRLGGRLLPWYDPRFRAVEPPPAPPGESGKTPRAPASYAHAVYLGVGRKQRFVDFILRTHAIAASDDEVYRPATGQGWLAAFIANVTGAPLQRTYVAASFAVGSSLLQAGRSLDDASAALQGRAADFDERMALRRQEHVPDDDAPFSLDAAGLLREWEGVHAPLGGTEAVDWQGALGPFIVIESVPLYRRADGSLSPAPEQAATFLNSFYIDDLTALVQAEPDSFGTALRQYLGPDSDNASRLDLLAAPALLADHAGAALIPAGRWPAPPKEHLALAQQAAVYQILDRIGRDNGAGSRGLMTVNGPPGTGKTTLLKDIIADIVVTRARRLCALPAPGALFGPAVMEVTGNSRASAPAIRADIMDGSEIVVTSSNNAAVQNISFELPFSCDRTAFPDAAYFPEVAALVAEKFGLPRKPPWGLLSAALGAKPNRDKIATALMGYEKAFDPADPATHPTPGEPASMKPRLDQARHHRAAGNADVLERWHAAKADFQARLDAVDAARAELVLAEAALRELPLLSAQRDAAHKKLAQLDLDLAAMQAAESRRRLECNALATDGQAALQTLAQRCAAQQAEQALLMDKLRETRDLSDPGWVARSLKKLLGKETRAYRQWKGAVTQARAALDAASAARKASEGERERTAGLVAQRARDDVHATQRHAAALHAYQADMAATTRTIDMLDARETVLREALDAVRGACLPDAAFIALPPVNRHRASLWMTRGLEDARSRLFIAALRLHEATVMATAEEWHKILRALRAFLGGLGEPRTQEDRAALWRSLFFIVPVVSTTLASFGRLFQGMGAESLGWVLVDEAGQATPASVAGALWRARRAVLVGDPLQIEPVVTVPRKLVESLGAKREMDPSTVARWSPSLQSAQTIGDRGMRLGARVGEVWTGMPLRTHRRCMHPMFEIANGIAYDQQMVQATGSKTIEPDLFASSWIDVRGEASGKVVAAEIETLRRIMASFLIDWPQVVDSHGDASAASVYVISPFRDVAMACKDVVGKESPLGRKCAKKKLVVDAGTVHTFQGKEASIVFLVLGSVPGEAGAGSRRWAASKPNLLNVAVTRAQQRFYVIGNYADWADLPFFSEMAESRGHMLRTRLEQIAGTRQVRLVAASSSGQPTVHDPR